MTKDTIYQFVGFITNIIPDKFTIEWERYATKAPHKKNDPLLLELKDGKKNKFSYISKHEWESTDASFAFMNDRKSEYFAEMPVRVVQTGGYVLLQKEKNTQSENGGDMLVAFIGHDEYDIDFYKNQPGYQRLNIYQAFYESCLYGYILEFFVPEKNTAELLQLLKQRNGVDAGLYKESLVLHN